MACYAMLISTQNLQMIAIFIFLSYRNGKSDSSIQLKGSATNILHDIITHVKPVISRDHVRAINFDNLGNKLTENPKPPKCAALQQIVAFWIEIDKSYRRCLFCCKQTRTMNHRLSWKLRMWLRCGSDCQSKNYM